jgi:hypothetical protein
VRGEGKELAVGCDEAGALQSEQDAARRGARQLGGTGEIAQRHRAARGAEFLQQTQTAVEALDEIGVALLNVAAFQLRHLSFQMAASRERLCLPSRQRMS